MPPQVSYKLACLGLKFDVGAEPNLAFPLCQQSIQRVSGHVDPYEIRASDVAINTAPYRMIPHVLEFRLETEAQILPDTEGLGNGQVLEKLMRAMQPRITR